MNLKGPPRRSRGWKWRGYVALVGVSLAFFIYPLLPSDDVINSDWPAFATGARLIASDPGHLYDLGVQERVQKGVTGGRVLISPGIRGILPFLAPAWVALIAVPFDAAGTDVGGRLWILFELVSLLAGLYLATRPRSPITLLPALASVPTALMMVNAQLDGMMALGLGAAIALWTRPYFAGLALAVTLMKPQLALPLGAAVLLARRWKVVAGWAAGGVVLLAPTLLLNPRWVVQWLGQIRSTVALASREVDVPHLATLLPGSVQTAGLAVLTIATIGGVLWLASRRRDDLRAAAAVLIAGGVLAAPHALPADLVLVAMALAIWGQAAWFEWLGLSVVALICATAPVPVPALLGVLMIGWVCLRSAGLITLRSPEPAPASAR